MEIIERDIAKATGAIKYFTGRPCVNGHVAPRYTQSGTCSECLRGAAAGMRSERDISPEISVFIANLAEINLRAEERNAGLLRETAAKLCVARCPGLRPEQVTSRWYPANVAGNTALYRVKVHPDDIGFMRDMADGLLTSSGELTAQVRDRIHGLPAGEWERVYGQGSSGTRPTLIGKGA